MGTTGTLNLHMFSNIGLVKVVGHQAILISSDKHVERPLKALGSNRSISS